MRFLHPIGMYETFVAQGVYTCYRHNSWHQALNTRITKDLIVLSEPDEFGFFEALIPSGVKEFWRLHQLPDGSRIIRADRRSYNADNGMHVLGTLRYDADDRPQQMHMHIYVDRALKSTGRLVDQQLFGQGVYTFFDDHVHVQRQTLIQRPKALEPSHELDEPQTYDVPLPTGYQVIFGRITMGMDTLIRAALRTASVSLLDQEPAADGTQSQQVKHFKPKSIPVFSPANSGGFHLHYEPSHLLRAKLDYYTIEPAEITTMLVGRHDMNGRYYDVRIMDRPDGGSSFGYSVTYSDMGVMLQNGSDYEYHLTQFVQSSSHPILRLPEQSDGTRSGGSREQSDQT